MFHQEASVETIKLITLFTSFLLNRMELLCYLLYRFNIEVYNNCRSNVTQFQLHITEIIHTCKFICIPKLIRIGLSIIFVLHYCSIDIMSKSCCASSGIVLSMYVFRIPTGSKTMNLVFGCKTAEETNR